VAKHFIDRAAAVPALSVPTAVEPEDSTIHAAVASVPEREAELRRVVAALLPQVDVLHVYLNGYEDVPDFLVDDSTAIDVARSQDWGNVRDNGKFFFLDRTPPDAYYVTVDDDLVYPADYVETLVAKIKMYGRRAVVGVHGVRLANPMTRFYANRTVLLYSRALPADESVHLLGTGTVAFYKDTLDLRYADFGKPGMADLWLAVAAKRQGIPMRCVARTRGWMAAQPLGDKPNLYLEFSEHDDFQTHTAKRHGPWDAAALSRANRELATDLLARFEPAALAARGIIATELASFL
jgi:hypothetical protein